MNTTWRNRTAVIAGAALILAGGAAVSAGASTVTSTTAVVATASAIDTATAKRLAFSREEERMARDLYRALADTYDGALPFSRIVNSEQRHYDAVGALLTRYGVTDPAVGRTAGSYADATIQKLYDGWLAEGKTSLAAAYGVGVALEKRDIADLKTAIAATSAADVKQLYTNLLKASEHHLAALVAQAEAFLRDHQILLPALSTLRRLAGEQRDWSRQLVAAQMMALLPPDLPARLDALLQVEADHRLSPLHALKTPPGMPTPQAVSRLTAKLDCIQATGVLALDLTWLNNNVQKALARHAAHPLHGGAPYGGPA